MHPNTSRNVFLTESQIGTLRFSFRFALKNLEITIWVLVIRMKQGMFETRCRLYCKKIDVCDDGSSVVGGRSQVRMNLFVEWSYL